MTRMLEVYTESLQRCLDHPQFLDRFYELFLASSEEVRKKFEQTDFPAQKRALRKSLLDASWIAIPGAESRAELVRLAETHSRQQRDIAPRLYDFWLDSLVRAVAETDPGCSLDVELAWRCVLRQVIDFVKARY